MRLTRRVALGGVYLDELHERIVIRNIDTGTPDENITVMSRMGGAGQRITGSHYNSLTVTVSYAIDIPPKKLTERREVMDAVNAWAIGGGWLVTNEMPGRRMWVEKVSIPSAGDIRDWTNEYTITFKAYGIPFWQDRAPTSKSKQMTKGSIVYDVGGIVETVLDVTFENISGKTIDSFTITCDNSTMTFASLGLAAKETLEITHTVTGLLRLRIRKSDGTTRSVMTKRSGADDLYVTPGRKTITMESKRAGILTVTATGRWL